MILCSVGLYYCVSDPIHDRELRGGIGERATRRHRRSTICDQRIGDPTNDDPGLATLDRTMYLSAAVCPPVG